MAAKAPVKFVKQYTAVSGNVFMRFEAQDGRVAEVRVREGWAGVFTHTRAEAKIEAARRMDVTVPCPNGCPDPVMYGVYIDPEYCAKRQAA